MAYNSSTTIVTAPVSIRDVQNALGKSDIDLGTLCVANTINKWSKYKPVVYPSLFDNNDGKGTVINTSSTKQMYGLTVPLTTDYFNVYKNGGGQWVYTRPTGGLASPFRLTDFNNYRRNATPPIYTNFKKDEFQDFNIFTTAFIIDFIVGNSLSIMDFSSAQGVTGNMTIGALLYQCPSATKTDLNTWQFLATMQATAVETYRKIITIADLANQHIYIADGSYYAFVFYLGDQSQQVTFTMPWDNDHYFAALFAAKALAYFEIPFVRLTPDINVGQIYYEFRRAAGQTYDISSIPTTFYLNILINTQIGYNGLNRNLVFGTQDRIKIRINGQSTNVFEGTLVDSSGNVISSETVNIPDGGGNVSTFVHYRFDNIPQSVWMIGQGYGMANYISVYVSHDSGTTWQGLMNPVFDGYCYFQ